MSIALPEWIIRAQRARWLPHVCALLVGCAGATTLLLNGWSLWQHTEPGVATPGVATSGVHEPAPTAKPHAIEFSPDINTIMALDLFGKRVADQPIDVASIPRTTLNLKLVGIIGSTHAGASRGLIAVDNNAPKAYYIGDALPGGASVHGIEDGVVLIARGDQLEKLTLHSATDAAVGPVPKRNAVSAAIIETPSGPPPATTEPAPTPANVYAKLEDRLKTIRSNLKQDKPKRWP